MKIDDEQPCIRRHFRDTSIARDHDGGSEDSPRAGTAMVRDGVIR